MAKQADKTATDNTRARDIIHRVSYKEFSKYARQMVNKGYIALTPGRHIVPNDSTDISWGAFISSSLHAHSPNSRVGYPVLYFPEGNEVTAGTEKKGTENLGYIEWGYGNTLPNIVSMLVHLLPYTASGIKFNTDLCAGLGPQPMYDISQYVGGNVTTRFIRYKDAGTFLHGQIQDKQRELLRLQAAWGNMNLDLGMEPDDTVPADPDPKDDKPVKLTADAEDTYNDLVTSLRDQISKLKAALEAWEKTNPLVQDFLERNNLPQTWLSLVLDQELFNICFPELLLNQQDIDPDTNKPVKTEKWKPRVVGITYRPCHTTRLERMDKFGHINYVYCCNRWLDPWGRSTMPRDSEITAVPALNTASPLDSLKSKIREAREKKVSTKDRPTRFVLPSAYPSEGRPYYPTPAWWSIFGGDIYEYLSTIISDRLSRKRNSNIIGRVIYFNQDYLAQLYLNEQISGDPEKQAEYRDQLYSQINTWLSNRNNAGQSLLGFTFTGSDGKEHKSFEIVEIEANSKSTADANEKETAEIASIVFMSMGLDARLMGSTPVSVVSGGGGSDLRVRYLLRLILKSPAQNIMLKPLEVISRYNEWDPRLVWQVQREVMTTLDRSKTGVTGAAADDITSNQ